MTTITSLLLTACNRKDLPKSYSKDFTIVLFQQYIETLLPLQMSVVTFQNKCLFHGLFKIPNVYLKDLVWQDYPGLELCWLIMISIFNAFIKLRKPLPKLCCFEEYYICFLLTDLPKVISPNFETLIIPGSKTSTLMGSPAVQFSWKQFNKTILQL